MRLIEQFFRLLVPTDACCLHCGDRTATSVPASRMPTWQSPLLRKLLCSSCIQAIPWITLIQCVHCGRAVPCQDCANRGHISNAVLQSNRSAVVLNEMMKVWLSEYKFKGDDRYSRLLGAMLLPAFYMICLQNLQKNDELAGWKRSGRKLNQFMKKVPIWDIVTSVPISKQRALDRGFNQAEQLALQLCSSFRLPYAPLVQRIEQSGHMSHKNKQERGQFAEQLYRSLSHQYYEQLRNTLPLSKQTGMLRVLIVDDVYTTGNTVRACASIIQSAIKSALQQEVQIYSLTVFR